MKLFLFLTTLIFSLSLFAQEAKSPSQAIPSSQPKALLQNKILMLGDSLTEGLGVAKDSAYPALVEKKLRADGKNWLVVNAGVSGSTSASGPSRLKWQLKDKPEVLFLALGANDGLRGFKVADIEKNLSETIEMAQKANVKVILAGMMMPPNYGEKYAKDFEALYPKIAKKYKIHLVPFLLKGVAGDSSLNQADGIHPNEKGYVIVADTVYNGIKGQL